MKTIFLIPPQQLPIPSVKGGAVEQLITYLLEENERFGHVRFVVLSMYDEQAAKVVYKNSTVYYYNNQTFECDLQGFEFRWILYSLKSKFLYNRFAKRLFKANIEPLSKYQYLCKYIAKKEKVDYISIEGQWELQFAFLKKVVHTDKIYAHIHTSRTDNNNIQQVFPNSISISEYVHRLWTNNKPINKSNAVVYNAANIHKFAQTLPSSRRNEIRAQYRITDEFLLLYCGRIITEKGVMQLIDAMKLLTDIPIKLLIVGSVAFGLNRSSEYAQAVMTEVEKSSNIISTGFINNDELPELFAACDIQIVPSIWQEGAGIVTIEGMAAGLPLIVTESGGMVEYVSDETAIKLPIDDNLSKNIADAIIYLYNNPDKRKKMSEAGRDRAKLFSKENYYKNFIKIFE